MKGTKSKGTWSFRTKLGFPSFFISCCIFFFFAGFYGSMLLSHDISLDGGGMAGPRLLESVEEVSEVLVPMAHGETGDSNIVSIPFQVLSWQPRALYFPNFATTKQCQSIIKIAKSNLAPSTLALRKGETAENTQGIRTSSGTFISASEDKTGVLEFIEKKIARATMVPRSHGEAFNVLRYEIGQRYDSHYDAFNPAEYGPQKSQRIASFLLYLSDVEEGGETMFPFENGLNMDNSYDYKACVGLKVKPRRGDGLLFYSVFPNGTIDQTSLHGSCPVIKGEKWVATKWIRDEEDK
ncbi:putative prolyl 4-hydroxylase 9 isoform X2 [Cinnamomum micranthum f. kanehirae]|uniref:procollagen-proline 4-dioxygenase n=1 Tax=Cinnamomum micranthum f. kanehirae TaxID=337451 RepID=A0A3S3LWG3_9MAGN|nr:putative prolyl 4-hydroxylase 9 isoform X2 [Cinnamomum micranthum f. kanehirae]